MLRFAVLGDIHYFNPRYHSRALAQAARDPGLAAYLASCAYVTENVLPLALEEVRAAQPDLVLQAGDLLHGGADGFAAAHAEAQEAIELLAGLNVPVLLCRGNHDGPPGSESGRAYEAAVLPFLRRWLGQSPPGLFYAVGLANCRFLVLDYLDLSRGNAQDRWLVAELERSRSGAHTFILSHAPLIPVARPFFSRLEFAHCLAARLRTQSVDALFCGHTHNIAATTHDLGSTRLLQVKTCVFGYPEQDPLPLTAARALVPPANQVALHFGFLEDSAPSWFLVETDGPRVVTHWRLLGRGEQATLVWHQPGDVQLLRAPDIAGLNPRLCQTVDLARARTARLHVAGYGVSAGAATVRVNGHVIGRLPSLQAFAPRQFLELSPAALASLNDENSIEIDYPGAEACIGALSLEVLHCDGTFARSTVDPGLYVTTHRWDGWDTPLRRYLAPGESIRAVVRFPRS
jgi:predicted phosphodiesterase